MSILVVLPQLAPVRDFRNYLRAIRFSIQSIHQYLYTWLGLSTFVDAMAMYGAFMSSRCLEKGPRAAKVVQGRPLALQTGGHDGCRS